MVKKIVALCLSLTLTLCSCGQKTDTSNTDVSDEVADSQAVTEEVAETAEVDESVVIPIEPNYKSMDDPVLLETIERQVYEELEDNEDIVVEDVEVVYVSKEYVEEMAYNSLSNIYFGYTVDEIEEVFNDSKYVFTTDDEGKTVVTAFEDYDDTYDQILENVVVGTGVILVCVTITLATGGGAAPAIHAIFAVSAESAATCAVISSIIGGGLGALAASSETDDVEEILKAAALEASEGYKWGAITGAATGAAEEFIILKIAASGGLTLDEAAIILSEHPTLPAKFIKQIKNMDEYNELIALAEKTGITVEKMAEICSATKYPLEIVKQFRLIDEKTIYYDQAKLAYMTVGGRPALVRGIDLEYVSEVGGQSVTNLERMQLGYAAVDPATGLPYELHHIGQTVDSPLAILSHAEHMSGGNNTILHDPSIPEGVHSLLSDAEWAAQRSEFWMEYAKIFL